MPAWETGVRSGTRASQPTLDADHKGTLYFVTDDGLLERWSGSAWSRVAGLVVDTSFPTPGDAWTDRVCRPDLDGLIFTHDGTRWVTEQVYEAIGMAANLSGSSSFLGGAPFDETGLDAWLLDWTVTAAVTGATHNGSDYYAMRLYSEDAGTSGAAASNLLAQIDTDDIASGASNLGSGVEALDQLLDVSATPLLRFQANIIGSPSGNLRGWVKARWRMVAT